VVFHQLTCKHLVHFLYVYVVLALGYIYLLSFCLIFNCFKFIIDIQKREFGRVWVCPLRGVRIVIFYFEIIFCWQYSSVSHRFGDFHFMSYKY